MRFHNVLAGCAVAGLGLLLGACGSQESANVDEIVDVDEVVAEVAPNFRSDVSINEVMVAVVDHNAHILWNTSLDEFKPRTEHDWHELEHAAITLTASGNMIMIPGPSQMDRDWVANPAWESFAQAQTDAAMRMLTAVREHNTDALEDAGGDLVDTCTGCHQQFKPEIPGIVATPEEQPEHYYGFPTK